MSAHRLSGASMHTSSAMFELSRPDLAAPPSVRRSSRAAQRVSTASRSRKAKVNTEDTAAAPVPERKIPVEAALSLPMESLRKMDPMAAVELYRSAVLREITDLMRAHALTLRDVSKALGRRNAPAV